MLLRSRRDDYLVIGKYTGTIIVGVGLLMVVPLVTSLVFAECDTTPDFVVGRAACLAFGYATRVVCRAGSLSRTWVCML